MTCRKSTCLLLAAVGMGLALTGCASFPCCEDYPREVVIIVPVPEPHPHPHPQPLPPVAEVPPPPRYEPAALQTDTGGTATKTRERPADTSGGRPRSEDAWGTAGQTRSR